MINSDIAQATKISNLQLLKCKSLSKDRGKHETLNVHASDMQ